MTLLEYMPEEYRGAPEVQATQDALEAQAAALRAARDDFFVQLDIERATWGLALWERAYGLAVDAAKPLEQRRERVISKIRGTGSVTAALIQNVAESYTNGQVAVDEYPGEYRFELRFVGNIGIPPNLDDLKAAIEEIKPAHLACGYVIIYRTWGQAREHTWGALAGRTWGAVKGGDI